MGRGFNPDQVVDGNPYFLGSAARQQQIAARRVSQQINGKPTAPVRPRPQPSGKEPGIGRLPGESFPTEDTRSGAGGRLPADPGGTMSPPITGSPPRTGMGDPEFPSSPPTPPVQATPPITNMPTMPGAPQPSPQRGAGSVPGGRLPAPAPGPTSSWPKPPQPGGGAPNAPSGTGFSAPGSATSAPSGSAATPYGEGASKLLQRRKAGM